jgi:hypothetical protein
MKRTAWLRKPYNAQGKAKPKKTIKAKVKKLSTSKLKKKLDAIFSQYIRQKYADSEGMVTCFTCPTKKHWKEMQCGHFISRSYLATRFDEDNCRPQDVGCNIFGNGKTVEFAKQLELTLGFGTVEKLFKKAREITRDFPYEVMIEVYKDKLLTLSPLLNN